MNSDVEEKTLSLKEADEIKQALLDSARNRPINSEDLANELIWAFRQVNKETHQS